MRNNRHWRGALVAFIVLAGVGTTRAHEEHMLIGRSADGQLKWHPAAGVPDRALTVLALIPPGGPIEG
jgi:hypothetical protein